MIAGFAYFRWAHEIPDFAELRRRMPKRVMEGICSGFRPGATSLLADGTQSGIEHNVADVGPLADPDDPLSWHELAAHPPVAMRRARRIDVWADGAELAIDAMFRDSCWDPGGAEIAVHEYELIATADLSGGTLTSMTARPRVLPYASCPGAAPNASWLVGTSMRTLRREVLERLRGTDCCTHLNDALRALADVAALLDATLVAGAR